MKLTKAESVHVTLTGDAPVMRWASTQAAMRRG